MGFLTINNGKEFAIKDHYKGFKHCALTLDDRKHEKLILEIVDCRGVTVRYDKTSQALDYLSTVHLTA